MLSRLVDRPGSLSSSGLVLAVLSLSCVEFCAWQTKSIVRQDTTRQKMTDRTWADVDFYNDQ
jgi:hypothetical protein